MRTGSDPGRRPGARQTGFTYIGMLLFVAITAATLAALGQSWSTAAQRERERELEFRGGEIARAILSYVRASPSSLQQYPTSLEDLLEDRRGPRTRHHLRRAYVDPFTGEADWVLVADGNDPKRFSAVHSRSDQLLMREQLEDGTPIGKASEWVFSAAAYQPLSAQPAAPAAPQAPGTTKRP